MTSSALAKSWSKTIEDVQNKADYYWEYGRTRGAFSWLGTSYNELDIPKHECAIVGRMLGLEDYVTHLEHMPEPEITDNMSDDELMGLMYFSRSLSNWVFVANYLLEKSEDDRKYIWNLNCVGKQGIPDEAYLELENGAASFRVSGRELFVLGDFEPGFFDEFKQVILENPEITRVVLGSGGGSVSDALKSGLLIREQGLETTLSDNCYSACPLVFIGGVQRTIWSPYPKLGFHQIYRGEGEAIDFNHPTYQLVTRYANRMGVDANFLISQMIAASPLEMNEPGMELLCESNIATWIQRLCSGAVHAGGFQKGLDAYNAGDYATALREWRDLAEQGVAEAQYFLAGLYAKKGQGVTQDDAEAVKWYRLAAEQGHANAQFALGAHYWLGSGVPLDYVLSYMWFNIAAASGTANASQGRGIVARKMTPAQIAEAQKLAREWMEKHQAQ